MKEKKLSTWKQRWARVRTSKRYLFDKIQDLSGYWEPCQPNKHWMQGWFNSPGQAQWSLMHNGHLTQYEKEEGRKMSGCQRKNLFPQRGGGTIYQSSVRSWTKRTSERLSPASFSVGGLGCSSVGRQGKTRRGKFVTIWNFSGVSFKEKRKSCITCGR